MSLSTNIWAMTVFISKTFVCHWNLLPTQGPFLGKNYLGYRENQETWSSEKLHCLALIQLAVSTREADLAGHSDSRPRTAAKTGWCLLWF